MATRSAVFYVSCVSHARGALGIVSHGGVNGSSPLAPTNRNLYGHGRTTRGLFFICISSPCGRNDGKVLSCRTPPRASFQREASTCFENCLTAGLIRECWRSSSTLLPDAGQVCAKRGETPGATSPRRVCAGCPATDTGGSTSTYCRWRLRARRVARSFPSPPTSRA